MVKADRIVKLLLFVGVVILVVASAQQLMATDVNVLRKNLSSPNVMARVGACQSLGNVNAKDQIVAVDALLSALEDVSVSVRLAAVIAMGRIGPAAAKAIPRLIECYQRDTVSKAEVVRTLGRIGPDSPEAIDFLIEVVRGGKSGPIRPLNGKSPPIALRQEAIVTLGKIGPNSSKCIPVLLDVLNVAAADLNSREQTFQTTAEVLGIIGIGNRRAISTLKRFQQGKGFHAKSTSSQAREHAIVAADSAVKQLEKAAKLSASDHKKNK
jgi:HEAT repeat protein